jgi:membrane protease YdiL (CAAX protease family)
MSFSFDSLLPYPLFSAAILAVTACVEVWVWIIACWRRQTPLLPYQPRRPVPWRGIDVLLMLMTYYFLPLLVLQATNAAPSVPAAAGTESAEKAPAKKHAIQQVLSGKNETSWPIVVSALLAILVAPITEELVFRLLLQGWLEAVERRARRRIHGLRRIVVGLMPVAIVAMLFAAVHIRPPGPLEETSTVVFRLQFFTLASLLVIAVILCWLKFVAGATLADIGIVPGKLAGDVRIGLLAFLAITPPVYAILIVSQEMLPETVVPDPIPLLFLGLALGVLYCRTHRIVPAMVLHAAFNAAGVFLALATSN